jgi:hypothetical protein
MLEKVHLGGGLAVSGVSEVPSNLSLLPGEENLLLMLLD